MSFPVLNYAKAKLLAGDYGMATSYYRRAEEEGVADCVINLRYLTKEYLVYPIEYENADFYFEQLKELHMLANSKSEYKEEYVAALQSLLDLRKLFLRSLALFYYSDILVTSVDSVVVLQIAELQRYIAQNKEDILENDTYELERYIPKYNKKKFAKDLNVIEAYCMNILLSYTAEQHSVYQGKSYDALTLDYGYFYSTTITERDRYYNYANVKPRMFMLGMEAYYFDLRDLFEKKTKEIGNFDSPKELKKELTAYVMHQHKKDASDKEFNQYAKHFEKKDDSRMSAYSTLTEIAKKVNPLLRLNPTDKLMKNNVGSFELDEYFPQKKFLGVCSMLSAGKGWKVDTVRYIFAFFACFAGIGAMAYFALAIAKKMGFYFGVNVEKP